MDNMMTQQDTVRTATLRAHRMLPVVARIARHMGTRLPMQVELDDLLGAGQLGLAMALRKYADRDDEAFEALAFVRIRGQMLDYLRRMDPLTRHQRRAVRKVDAAAGAAAQDESLEAGRILALATERVCIDSISDDLPGNDSPADDSIDSRRAIERMRRQIRAMRPRMQTVVLMHLRHCTLKQIAAELGVTESRACQLRGRALAELREAMVPA